MSLVEDSSGTIFAGSYSNGNGVFLSTDGGDTWARTAMSYGVTALTVTSQDAIVAFSYGAGFGRYLFRLTNGGTDLDSVVLPFTPATIVSTPGGWLLATSLGQGIYRSSDEGSTWTLLDIGLSSSSIQSPLAMLKNGRIIVGTQMGVFTSVDTGRTWQHCLGIHDSASFKQLTMFRDSVVYLAAYEGMGIDASEVYVSTDGGQIWSLRGYLKQTIDAIAVDSSGNVYAGGSFGVYRINPDGDTSYVGLSGIAVNGWGVRSIMVDSANSIFAGGWGGVYRSTDAGVSWQLLNDGMQPDSSSGSYSTPIPFDTYISCGVVDRNGDFYVGSDSAGVFRSRDRGKTWMQTGLTIPLVTSVVLDSVGGVVAGTLVNGVFLSSDHGSSWSLPRMWQMVAGGKYYTLCAHTQRLPRGGIDSTFMFTENSVFAGTNNGVAEIIYEADLVLPVGLWSTNVRAIVFLSSNDVRAATDDGAVYASQHAWTIWEHVGNVGGNVSAMAANGTGALFAVGSSGFFRSTDGGKTWDRKNGGIADTNLVSVLVDSTGALFVGSYTKGEIYVSSNRGDTWSRIASLGYPVRCLMLDLLNDVYAGVHDRLYRIHAVPASALLTPVKVPERCALEQNFPNPFNPSTVISYQLPTSGLVTLKVYDILGRVIKTLVNQRENAGYHSVILDAGNLPSGVYFYRLQAGSHSETKRLLLLK